ncbi:hypothetical protein AC233_32090 [Burkholderia sp. HB1]|nr:hypothetical protein AC233_32090 [Burkholderia sp. HB1]
MGPETGKNAAPPDSSNKFACANESPICGCLIERSYLQRLGRLASQWVISAPESVPMDRPIRLKWVGCGKC